MRVIKVSRVKAFWIRHPKARSPLEQWLTLIRHAEWKNVHELKRVYRNADTVQVSSGRTVVVFDIGGNNYRLICALHYNRQKIFVLRFLTHAEYSKDIWKSEL
jgi:mRNA interferase HigB